MFVDVKDTAFLLTPVPLITPRVPSPFGHLFCCFPSQVWKNFTGKENKGNSPKGKMATGRVVVKALDMVEEVKEHAISAAKEALAEYKLERDVAKQVKQIFDKKYEPTWHCIVGKSFGSFVTHETNCFIYFYVDDIAFLLWKSG